MKYGISIIVFSVMAFLSANVFANCMAGNITAKPNQKSVIPSNGSVIVTFFGTEQEKAEKNKDKKVFFVSGKHRVEAKLIKTWESEYKLKALQFKAVKALKLGKSYELKVAGKTFSWKVGKKDEASPKWVNSPKQISFKKQRFGCGPAINYILSAEVSDASPVFYDVVLKTKDGKKQQFFVQPRDGKVQIGHGMCSGQFVPPQGSDAQVEMTPYDFAGNKGKTKSITLKNK